MAIVNRGFQGRRRQPGAGLIPPGQYLVDDFPVLTAGPTPDVVARRVGLHRHRRDRRRLAARWTWPELRALPAEDITVDIHCVTKWSKLGTRWTGVSVDTLLDGIETSAEFVVAFCDGGYTTNLPLADVLDGQAWVAFGYDGADLERRARRTRLGCSSPTSTSGRAPSGCAGLRLLDEDEPGFWESVGYHNYGDPWREQRYWGD